MLQSLLEALDREKLVNPLEENVFSPILAFIEAIATSGQSWLCEAYSDFRITPVKPGFNTVRLPLGKSGICSELP